MEKINTYLVAITIIEGRHYVWDNMNSAVIVRVGNKKKSTTVQKCTDSPFYNEYFVFEIESTYDKFLEKSIVITVIQPRTFCRRRKILGGIKLDIATVVNQKNAQFYHRWAVLSSPKADVATGPTGYLKVDMAILARGQTPRLPLHIVNDEIEGNLLTPIGFIGERQRARFIFDVYKCQHLQPKSAQFLDYSPGNKQLLQDHSKLSTYVVISFTGTVVNTTVRKNTSNPIFNERLTITDLFPPLCQRVKIEICSEGIKKPVQAIHHLNLKHISNDTVEGFLPTFGPTYIHMYSKHKLEGYAGTILISMRTEFLDDTVVTSAAQRTNVQHGITPLLEEAIFAFEELFLCVVIFEANCIWKKYHDKPIAFRTTLGNVASQIEFEGGTGEDIPSNVTIAEKPLKTGKNFYYMNYAEQKPCLRIEARFPDFRKRMFHSNMLEKLSKHLKSSLDHIEIMFSKYNPTMSQEIEERLKETTDVLFTAAKKYVEIITTNYDFNNNGNELDKERTKMCLRTMNGILDRLQTLQNNKSKKFVYRHLDDIQKKIESLVEDAQPCWPDVFLWITSANKKIDCLRIPAREIAFSHVEEERGEFCGQIRPLLFQLDERNVIVCKTEVLMWIGLNKQKKECFSHLPEGFKLDGRYLVAEEKHLFEGKAHIFEGEVQPGFDASGLVDPFVQVSLARDLKETQIKKHVLVPLWDQTLTFYNIQLYGTKQHIKNNPPTVMVQLFDDDPISIEFVGRAIVKPHVLLLDEPEDTIETKLTFYYLYKRDEIFGRLLAAFELKEIMQPIKAPIVDQIVALPPYLKPRIESYRVEVLFWGVRNLKRVNLIRINRPKVTFYCGNKYIESHVIDNARKCSNFTKYIVAMDVNMASQKEYPETFQFKLFDSRKFGIYVFAGISISETTPFLFTPITVEERLNLLSGIHNKSSSFIMHSVTSSEVFVDNWERAIMQRDEDMNKKVSPGKRCWRLFVNAIKGICNKARRKRALNTKSKSEYSLLSATSTEEEEDSSDFDWWTKFYASLDALQSNNLKKEELASQRNKLKIYPNELENQPEFKGFSDILTTFEIFKGKRTGDDILDEQLTTAIFKGAVKIYQWPPLDGEVEKYVTPSGNLVKNGAFDYVPANTPVNYILRIYCIRAIHLRPKDLNGKSDPYIQIQLGQKVMTTDRENYVPKDVNPIFGRCFEYQGSFPDITSAVIRILDYDITTADDLIGETKIDLENRYYTKYRANCGIAETYYSSGYCKWRDQKKPTDILSSMCKKWGLSPPEFKEKSVIVGAKEMFPVHFKISEDSSVDKENLALEALHRWQEIPVVGFKLVPEHVETRSLFTPDKPGIEQGKLQLWIDIFPRTDYPVPEKVNVTPRKPISYELRVVIWNTEDVILAEDDFFSGEKKSDIYVKGWLDQPQNMQYTDVHYRSLTGEGNFNWRFIFKFDYLSTENKLVLKKKDSVFSKDHTEIKVPCVLNLTIWDNDTFSADDFLGLLTLELSRLPRGARSAKQCNLNILETSSKKINLFKCRRTKGWWPFRAIDRKTQKQTLGGKLEAEFEILTKEEAELNPVGLGRQGPEPLPPPKRPDTSFTWFRNPLKSCKYVVCKTWRWKILRGCFCLLLIAFIILAVYNIPGAHGDRSQHRHLYHHALIRNCNFGNPFKPKCVHCKNDRSKDCKIFFITLLLVGLLFVVIMFFYFEGYFTSSDLGCSSKKKRESIPTGLEENFI